MRKVIILAGVLLLASAGPALAAAKTKAGDIDLRFRTQIENDFEFRDNYDFDDTRAAVANDKRDSVFVETEVRIGFDGKAGNWRTHVLLESEDLWDRQNEGGGSGRLGLERAWAQYNFGNFTLRAGPSEYFKLDPASLVYADDDGMVRVFGKAGTINWQFGWIRRNDDGQSNSAGAVRSEDQDLIHGSFVLPVKNGGVNLNVTPFVLYNHDKTKGPTLSTFYFGVGAKGTTGPVNVLGEFAYVTGTDDTGVNTTTGATGVDVAGWAAIVAVAYPIPNSPLTVEVGGVWSSGDDNSGDSDAEGFTGVFHDVELLNPDGIWVDDDIRVFAKNGVGDVRVKEDDKFWTVLTSDGLAAQTSNSEDFNLSNPGIQIYHAALHYKATPQLNVSGIFEHVRLFESVNNVGGVATVDVTDKELGNEFAVRAVWKPEKYVTITPQLSYLIPGGAIEQLTGKDDAAFNFITEFRVSF
ncbi:MAG: hypothetical protein ACE5HK_00790 [Candidatus Methylomirabilales bacterium]